MKFQIARSVDSQGNIDFFTSYIPKGCKPGHVGSELQSDKIVEIVEIAEDEALIYASKKSLGALEALAEMDNESEDSFSKVLEELIHEAFNAGRRFAKSSLA